MQEHDAEQENINTKYSKLYNDPRNWTTEQLKWFKYECRVIWRDLFFKSKIIIDAEGIFLSIYINTILNI